MVKNSHFKKGQNEQEPAKEEGYLAPIQKIFAVDPVYGV